MAPLYLVVNPKSGANVAQDVLRNHVEPLLRSRGVEVVKRYETRAAGDGERIGKEIRSRNDKEAIDVILLGGDGTTHELLQGLFSSDTAQQTPTVRFVLVPTGTANALYAGIYPPDSSSRHRQDDHDDDGDENSGRLRSLRAYLSNSSNHYPLSLMSTSLQGQATPTLTHIITSHALHAAILHDSEALRATHPGIERFKVASAQNAVRWVDGRLELQPREGGNGVEVFDPKQKRFVPCEDAMVEGPFWYMICTTTDRLEPAFVPAPFTAPNDGGGGHDELARPRDALDVVVIRPLRDPIVRQHLNSLSERKPATYWDSEESRPAREAFARARATPLTQAMYSEGKHVYLRYGEGDGELKEDDEGLPVVEYYRCAGYRWLPVSLSVAHVRADKHRRKHLNADTAFTAPRIGRTRLQSVPS